MVGVGYHLRALDIMAEVRRRLASAPAQLVVARWLDSTPGPAWWGRVDEGGGQVIEQATHLYDLARWLVGEAIVVGAASTRDPAASPPTVDVADSSAAVLRFADGAIGSFANTRRLATAVIEVELVSDGLLTRLTKRPDRGQGDWHATFDDGTVIHAIAAESDPYELQAAAFLDAVDGRRSGRVLCTYADALQTDRLTRAVVAATGRPADGRQAGAPVSGAAVTNVNRRWPGWIGSGSATKRWTPTLHSKAIGASKVTGSNPAAANHPRTSMVRSGGRRCRVQMTVALRAHSIGKARTVRSTSSSLMFPKTPQTRTRSAGTAPTYGSVDPASADTTSIPGGAFAAAVAASSWSSSTKRP